MKDDTPSSRRWRRRTLNLWRVRSDEGSAGVDDGLDVGHGCRVVHRDIAQVRLPILALRKMITTVSVDGLTCVVTGTYVKLPK